jgi:calcium-binding protein CML
MAPAVMERVFRKFDADSDDQISRMAAVFESVGHATTDDEVSHMMEEADAHGDGCFSLPEIAALVRSGRHRRQWLITPAELAHVLRGIGEPATVVQCHRMIQGVNKNCDDLVSFDEFKIMMPSEEALAGSPILSQGRKELVLLLLVRNLMLVA